MKRVFIFAVILCSAGGASAAPDCERVRSAISEYRDALANYFGVAWALAFVKAGVDPDIITPAAKFVTDQKTIDTALRFKGQGALLVKARTAVLRAAGCGQSKQSAAQIRTADTPPCRFEGKKQPRIGMSLKKARECFGEFRLMSETPGMEGIERVYKRKNGSGSITVLNGRIIRWDSY